MISTRARQEDHMSVFTFHRSTMCEFRMCTYSVLHLSFHLFVCQTKALVLGKLALDFFFKSIKGIILTILLVFLFYLYLITGESATLLSYPDRKLGKLQSVNTSYNDTLKIQKTHPPAVLKIYQTKVFIYYSQPLQAQISLLHPGFQRQQHTATVSSAKEAREHQDIWTLLHQLTCALVKVRLSRVIR